MGKTSYIATKCLNKTRNLKCNEKERKAKEERKRERKCIHGVGHKRRNRDFRFFVFYVFRFLVFM